MNEYQEVDGFAGRCASAAIESGGAPYTVEELCRAIRSPMPVSAEDLRSLACVCRTWGIRTVLDGDMLSWDAYKAGAA